MKTDVSVIPTGRSRSVLVRGLLALFVMSLPTVTIANTATVRWSGLMLRFDVATGSEFQDQQTYASSMSLDVLPPDQLQPGILTVDYYNSSGIWKVIGFYRIETPGNPQNNLPRRDDFLLNLPMVDGDADGVPDLFEVQDAVNAVETVGIFENRGYTDDLKTVWNRAAGSPTGECVVRFSGSLNPGDPTALFIATYTNHFFLTDLKGTLAYRTGWEHSTGAVAVARDDSNYYYEGGTGNVGFTRSGPDQLQLTGGTFNYYGNNELQYVQAKAFSRVRSNYWGIVRITNGVMASLDPLFRDWLWRIVDLNDSDHDGIPDLSDDAPAFPPLLSLQRTDQSLDLKMSGEPDAAYVLESAETLTKQGTWLSEQNVTIPPSGSTNLILSAGTKSKFWRALFP